MQHTQRRPSLPPSPRPRLVPASLLHGCFCHCVGPNKSSIVQQKKQRPIHAAWNPARRRRRRIEARRLRLSLPRYSLSRRLFDSPEREENYGKNETEGKNDEGEGGRGESRTGKHRTRVNISPQGPLLAREREEVDRDDIISQLKRMQQQGWGIP